MAEYDHIKEGRIHTGPNLSYNGQKYSQVRAAFQYACRVCNPDLALHYALEAYLAGPSQRKGIIDTLFLVTLEDKGLANTMLFTQVFQLMVPLLTREQDEAPVEETTAPEKWKVIADHSNYEVSSAGRVRSKKEKKPVKTNKLGNYNHVTLDKSTFRVDMLVGEAFVKRKRETDKILEHIDDNLTNDAATNLRWLGLLSSRPKTKEPFIEFKYIKRIDFDNLDPDPDRLSYIYRFTLAVWLIAVSPTTRINGLATLLFEDVIAAEPGEEGIAAYIEKYGSTDECREDLFQALLEKNMSDCLYYAKVLHYHPLGITVKNLKWARSRNGEGKLERVSEACVYIWDCFTRVASKISHVIPYLESMRSLALTEAWRSNDQSRLLYAHFIHLWCMDPITAYADMKRDTRTLVWGEQKITGSFSSDFRVKGRPARILGKWSSLAVVDTDEPVLFPISYPEFLEPMMPNIVEYEDTKTGETVSVLETELKVTDPLTGKELIAPDFNPFIQEIVDGKMERIPKPVLHKNMSLELELDERNMHLLYEPPILVKEDPKWQPLCAFYSFLRFYNYAEISDRVIAIYGETEDFFPSRDYPDPFQKGADLTKTEFFSFRPYLNSIIGAEEDKSPYVNINPERRKIARSRSTFFYRAIPSPIKRPMPAITVTRTERESPLKRAEKTPAARNKNQPRIATERTIRKEPSPMPSPFQKMASPSDTTFSFSQEASVSEASSPFGSETDYSTESSASESERVARSPVAPPRPKSMRVRVRNLES